MKISFLKLLNQLNFLILCSNFQEIKNSHNILLENNVSINRKNCFGCPHPMSRQIFILGQPFFDGFSFKMLSLFFLKSTTQVFQYWICFKNIQRHNELLTLTKHASLRCLVQRFCPKFTTRFRITGAKRVSIFSS